MTLRGRPDDNVGEPRRVALPSRLVGQRAGDPGDANVERTTLSVRDAIESLAYDFLEQTHGGWENNEGVYGEFTFDVAQRTITLDYNERVETSEYSQHMF